MKMVDLELDWENIATLNSRKYICGYCGNSLVSQKGYIARYKHNVNVRAYIYICHHCDRPSYFDPDNIQTPGHSFGNTVDHITSKEVETLYDEARNCTIVGAYTASVLCSRKLLMNIAVSKGANQGLSFVEYVEHLSNNGFIPPGGEEWVDHIRRKGNEAAHEIKIMVEEDAEDLINFLEMLLKFIYEFPAKIKLKKKD